MCPIALFVLSISESFYNATRSIVKQLRPEMLDVLGLQGAVAEMVQRYERLHPTCEFKLQVKLSFPVLPILNIRINTAFSVPMAIAAPTCRA